MNQIKLTIFILFGVWITTLEGKAQQLSPVCISNAEVILLSGVEAPNLTELLNVSFLISDPEQLEELTVILYQTGDENDKLLETRKLEADVLQGDRVIYSDGVPYIIDRNRGDFDLKLREPADLTSYRLILYGTDKGGLPTVSVTIDHKNQQ